MVIIATDDLDFRFSRLKLSTLLICSNHGNTVYLNIGLKQCANFDFHYDFSLLKIDNELSMFLIFAMIFDAIYYVTIFNV